MFLESVWIVLESKVRNEFGIKFWAKVSVTALIYAKVIEASFSTEIKGKSI